jgi:MFS transporter, putative metabolite:H+ symporter
MGVLGFVIGSIGITLFADSYGRKPAFILIVLILGIGSVLEAASQNMAQLAIFRVLAGVGAGAGISILSVYVAEMSPKSKRGAYTSVLILSGVIGLVSSGMMSIFLIKQEHIFGLIDSWRVIMIIPGIASFLALPFRWHLPESPRWLLSKGQFGKANATLESMGIAKIEYSAGRDNPIENEGMLRLFSFYFGRSRHLLLRLILLVAIWSLILVPINASSLLPVTYVNVGYTIFKSTEITTIGVFGFVVGAILSIIFADKFERKYQICITAALLGIGFIFRGLLIHDYVGLVIAGFVTFASTSWLTACLLTYTSENFPTQIRSFTSGAVKGIANAIASFGPMIFVLFQPYGFLNAMIGLGVFSMISAVMIVLFGRATAGKSLEELAI